MSPKTISSELNNNKMDEEFVNISNELTTENQNNSTNLNLNSIDLINQQSSMNPINNQQLNELKVIIKQEFAKLKKSLLVKELKSINESNELDFNYKLNWQLRNQLMALLNDYSLILISNNNENFDKILDSGDKLILLLTQLISNGSELKGEKLNENNSNVVLNLNNQFKLDIIIHLIKNRDYLNNLKSIGEGNKMKLFDENKDLIAKLMNLSHSIEYSYQIKEDENELLKVRLDLTPQITYSFKFDSIKELIEKGVGKLDSLMFNFANAKWFISIRSNLNENDNKKYLGVYIFIEHDLDDGEFKCDAYFELRMLNQLTNDNDRIKKYNYTYKQQEWGRGFRNFISSDELLDDENGFIKSNSIIIQVYLKTNGPIKI